MNGDVVENQEEVREEVDSSPIRFHGDEEVGLGNEEYEIAYDTFSVEEDRTISYLVRFNRQKRFISALEDFLFNPDVTIRSIKVGKSKAVLQWRKTVNLLDLVERYS
jgi:hypothetical protein